MPSDSTMARWQRRVLATWVLAVCAWLAWSWDRSPALAWGGAAAIALAHVAVLAAEFILLPWVARHDRAPPSTPGERLRAWGVESWLDLRVFGWQQPFRWRRYPDRLAGPGVAGRRGIVLVHGIACNRGFWNPWLAQLGTQQRGYVAVNLEPPIGRIEAYVPVVEDAVRRLAAATGKPPLLVGHSMGGLVARAWLQQAQPGRIAGLVTLATPHAGAWIARFSHLPQGLQMRRGSAWLRELAGGWGPALAARTTCWYSNCDNVVLPPSTATLEGAHNRLVRGAAHVELAFRPEVMREVLAMLDDGVDELQGTA